MEFKLNSHQVADKTVLLVGVRYENQTSDKVWTYALLKAAGLWYMTGTGRVPQAAGWGAVERWLAAEGREVVFVEVVTGRHRIYPEVSPDAATPDQFRDLVSVNFSADLLPEVLEIVNAAIQAGADAVVELAVLRAAEKIFRRKREVDEVDTSQASE